MLRLFFFLVFVGYCQNGWSQELPAKTNFHRTIQELGPVGDQGSRNTCTTFATTAHLEHILLKEFGMRGVNLSEQWLQILNVKRHDRETSNASSALFHVQLSGLLNEGDLPYSGKEWKSGSRESIKFCNSFEREEDQRSCRWAQFDLSRFDRDDAELKAMQEKAKSQYPELRGRKSVFLTFEEAKAALARGETVILDLDFYYGAWNHPEAANLGIPRDNKLWLEGIVGYPLEKTKDDLSLIRSPGHSVLLVGYDDTKKIKAKHTSLTSQKFTKTYQGVFVIRNSLGTNRFGSNFKIDGKHYPGYGIITQDYVRDYGVFVQLQKAD